MLHARTRHDDALSGALGQGRGAQHALHVTSLGSIGLCIGLWIRAKTVDQDERGNAERRALFVGPVAADVLADGRLAEGHRVGARAAARPVDESAALDEPAPACASTTTRRDAPEDGRAEGHWHVDSGDHRARPGGRRARRSAAARGRPRCRLVGQYEFADARILRGVYRGRGDLLGRDMLLEGRFFGLRFYLGVRVTGVIDETRDGGRRPERVWGWCYQTLEGHLEQGRLSYEVIKNLTTGPGDVPRRAATRGRRPSRNPVIRLGFPLFGRWTQQRFYRNIQVRMTALVRGSAARPARCPPRGTAGRHRAGAVRRPAASAGTAGPRMDSPGKLNSRLRMGR